MQPPTPDELLEMVATVLVATVTELPLTLLIFRTFDTNRTECMLGILASGPWTFLAFHMSQAQYAKPPAANTK